jgi:hypothetical protein
MILIEVPDRRIDWEAAKTRVLSVFWQPMLPNESGLTKGEVRAITHLGRSQVKRLMDALRNEGQLRPVGRGHGAAWFLCMRRRDERYGSEMAGSVSWAISRPEWHEERLGSRLHGLPRLA